LPFNVLLPKLLKQKQNKKTIKERRRRGSVEKPKYNKINEY
jgi:hypothetical protein